MNKQEVIEKIKGISARETFMSEIIWVKRDEVLDIVEQLDESEKPIVPQFVADWYERNSYSLERNIYALCIQSYQKELPKEEFSKWFDDVRNRGIETLVKMKLFGYEVEKEKLYTVKFSNEDFGKIYIGIFKKFNKLGISSLPLNDDDAKTWFTEDELKRFKFWENPAFEIDEVKE